MYELDLLKNESIQSFIKKWDDKKLDVLVNNAGYGVDNFKRCGIEPTYEGHE